MSYPFAKIQPLLFKNKISIILKVVTFDVINLPPDYIRIMSFLGILFEFFLIFKKLPFPKLSYEKHLTLITVIVGISILPHCTQL